MAITDASAETWHEIEGLVDELSNLAKKEISTRHFYGELLAKSVHALGAFGGAAWIVDERDRLQAASQINLDRAVVSRSPEAISHHQRILDHIVLVAQPKALPPGSVGTDELELVNPSEHLLLLCPVQTDERVVAVVEIFQDTDKSPSVQRGNQQLLSVLCEMASEFHRNWQLRRMRDRQQQWDDYEQFLWRLHNDFDVEKTAYTIANDGRRLIDCDRVSVIMCRGRRCRMRSISGLDTIDKRSSAVRNLIELSRMAIKGGEPLWYNAEEPAEGVSLGLAFKSFAKETGVQLLGVIPLCHSVAESKSRKPELVGALVVEVFSADHDSDTLVQRSQSIAKHASAALYNADRVAQMPLIFIPRLLGRMRWLTRLRQLPRTLLLLVMIAAAVAAMIMIPADLTISAPGELRPLVMENIYAPYDGTVDRLTLGPQDVIRAGFLRGESPAAMNVLPLGPMGIAHTVLMTAAIQSNVEASTEGLAISLPGAWTMSGNVVALLRSSELDYELTTILGDLQTTETEFATVLTTLTRLSADRRNPESENRFNELSARRVELQASLDSFERRRAIIRQQIDELTIRASIDGSVQTWDVVQKLRSRPVRQGQKLMTIVNPHGPWTVDVYVPDKYIGYVTNALANSENSAAVSFVLKSTPGTVYNGRINSIPLSSEVHESFGPSARLSIELDADTALNDPRPGTSVVAKIHCGRASIGYVWCHDLIDWVRSKLFL